jgi:hypothetical protein
LSSSTRGHAGRHSAFGGAWRFSVGKRARSDAGESASADASASTIGAVSSTSIPTFGRDVIAACTQAVTATERWWNNITSNQRPRRQKTGTTPSRAAYRANDGSSDNGAARITG